MYLMTNSMEYNFLLQICQNFPHCQSLYSRLIHCIGMLDTQILRLRNSNSWHVDIAVARHRYRLTNEVWTRTINIRNLLFSLQLFLLKHSPFDRMLDATVKSKLWVCVYNVSVFFSTHLSLFRGCAPHTMSRPHKCNPNIVDTNTSIRFRLPTFDGWMSRWRFTEQSMCTVMFGNVLCPSTRWWCVPLFDWLSFE